MRRSLKRRDQSRNASADNDGRAADIVYVGGHMASMRSIADPDPRLGSIVTAWRYAPSASRIEASVMRFMCGQRLDRTDIP